MNDDGWIKIHRSIWKNPWMCRPNVLTVWMYILCHVNYQQTDEVFEGKRITLEPGQGIFKFTKVASEIGVPQRTLYRVIELLENEKQIVKQASPRNTVITVVNWEKYQLCDKQNGKQMANKWQTNGKQNENLPIKDKEYKEYKEIYKEKEINKEKESQKSFSKVAKFYDERFPMTLNLYKATQLDDLVESYGEEAVMYAIREAHGNGAGNMNYIRTVAMNESRRRENGNNSNGSADAEFVLPFRQTL